jgi:hypothetical protein
MWLYRQHQTRRRAREKIERTEEPLVGVSQVILTASFYYPKIALHDNNWERKYVPRPILTPLLNILDFILGAAYNRHS